MKRKSVTSSIRLESFKWLDQISTDLDVPKTAVLDAALYFLMENVSQKEIEVYCEEYRKSLPGSPWRISRI